MMIFGVCFVLYTKTDWLTGSERQTDLSVIDLADRVRTKEGLYGV